MDSSFFSCGFEHWLGDSFACANIHSSKVVEFLIIAVYSESGIRFFALL